MAFKDRRRTDPRDQIQGRPFWVTSAIIDVADVAAGTTVLYSFENTSSRYFIDACVMDIIVDLNAGTVNVGHGSIPARDSAESATLTTTTADSLWASATGDETSGTIKIADDITAATLLLKGALTTTPIIVATIATAVTGKFKVHFRVTELPA